MRKVCLVMLIVLGSVSPAIGQEAERDDQLVIDSFLQFLIGNAETSELAFQYLDQTWHPGYVAMFLDTLSLSGTPAINRQIVAVLEERTGQDFGVDLSRWYRWLWNEPERLYPAYADFKSALYSLIDPRFAAYFDRERPTDIRLDEIRWGGVRQDGIPPLRGPKMLAASEADYLDDSNIVFGIEVNGDARAYPKRILAWHEMFVDTVGGVAVAGVYCTLCGSMILYETEFGGTNHVLGTSGFLYRSNKLMYDRATQSLWNTLWGRPVVGPLVGQGIELAYMGVVTTTWGAWRERHPDTSVLSLDTGYRRDYSEGAAYRDYFSTDELMFDVPTLDTRLNNKDEVLTLKTQGSDLGPLAIASAFLEASPLYHDRLGEQDFVVLTDRSGAHRVYAEDGVRFVDWDRDSSVTDADDEVWTVTEDQLVAPDGRVRARIPAHRAFWFGWYAAYPETRLVH